MNDLEQAILKLNGIKEIIDSASDSIDQRNYNKAESLNYAAIEYFELLLNEVDQKFQKAWKATVSSLKHSQEIEKWTLKLESDLITGELYVNLPQELLDSAGLKEGNALEWRQNEDDSFTIVKI
jgi:hypothetical protein